MFQYHPSWRIYFGHVLNFKTQSLFLKRGPSCSFWLGNVFTFMKCWHWAGCDWEVKLMPALFSHPVWAQGQGRVFPQNAQETPRIYPRDTLRFHLWWVFSRFLTGSALALKMFTILLLFLYSYAGLGFIKHPKCLMKKLHNWDLILAYIHSVIQPF